MGIDPSLIRVWRRRIEGAPDATVSAARPASSARLRSPGGDSSSNDDSAGVATPPTTPVTSSQTAPPARQPTSLTPSRVSRPDSTEGTARAARLDALRAEHDASCPHCTTATAHTQTVFGEGSPVAEVVFVGEAPGETEDRLGRPFVGRAGEKLDQIITAMGLARGDVYIANVLKSRPPDNRTPLRCEIDGCGPYLRRQIEIIQPRAIVTLGGPATQLLLEVTTGITRLRGIWSSYTVGDREVPVMPTFHPAYLLRNYTPETRRQVWEDMQKVLELLGVAR